MKNLISLVIFFITVQGFSQAEVFEKTVTLDGRRINIDADLASTIKVTTWNKDQVQVKVTYELNDGDLNEAVSVDLGEQSSRIKLKLDVDDKVFRNANVSDCEKEDASSWGSRNGTKICVTINVELFIPEKTVLDIETVIADVTMDGIFKELDIKSVTGDIDVTWPERQGTELELKTVTGNIFTDFDFNGKKKKGLPIISSHKFATIYKGGEGYLKLESVTSNIYLRKGD